VSSLEDAEKRSVISTGTSLFMEGVRESTRPAGKNVPLTCWFYALQTSVKVALQTGQLVLNNINRLGSIYDINLYKLPTFTQSFGKRLMNVAQQTDLDFELKGDKIVSKISRRDARSVFEGFLKAEYEYAVSSNLADKSFDAHTEVIVWHLLNDIYEYPRPVGYERKLAYDIINDFSVDSELRKIWNPEKLDTVPILLDGWVRALVETKKFDVIQMDEIGAMYSPPRFSEVDTRVLYSGPHPEICRSVFEKAMRAPAWPIEANASNNNACYHLTSAGLIEYVSEKTKEIRNFGYVVPRDLFVEVDAKLGYLYQDKGYEKDSDITLTEQIFRTIGRARLASQVLDTVDYKSLDTKLKKLESGEVAHERILETVLEPLLLKGCIELDKVNKKFRVVPGMEKDINIMLDIWSRTEMLELNIPEEEFAFLKRAAQTRIQTKKNALKLFKME